MVSSEKEKEWRVRFSLQAQVSVQQVLKEIKKQVRNMELIKHTLTHSKSKIIACPNCRATIDLIGQDIESESNFYFCANCGLVISKPRK